jgi:hypothetical protein
VEASAEGAGPPPGERGGEHVIETEDVRLAAYALLRGARLLTVRNERRDIFRLEAPRVEEIESDFYHFGISGVDEELFARNLRLLRARPGKEVRA